MSAWGLVFSVLGVDMFVIAYLLYSDIGRPLVVVVLGRVCTSIRKGEEGLVWDETWDVEPNIVIDSVLDREGKFTLQFSDRLWSSESPPCNQVVSYSIVVRNVSSEHPYNNTRHRRTWGRVGRSVVGPGHRVRGIECAVTEALSILRDRPWWSKNH